MLTTERKIQIEKWVTDAARKGDVDVVRREYDEMPDEERAYARSFDSDYAASPLTDFAAKLMLLNLQMLMIGIEREMELEAELAAQSDAANWNGGRVR